MDPIQNGFVDFYRKLYTNIVKIIMSTPMMEYHPIPSNIPWKTSDYHNIYSPRIMPTPLPPRNLCLTNKYGQVKTQLIR